MTAGNEHTFVRSIHGILRRKHPTLYVWKINANYAGGVPDAYYSMKSDLWVEYKYLKSLPQKPETIVQYRLSELQKDWLIRRDAEGRDVCVVVGSPQGNLIFPGTAWRRPITSADFISRAVDNIEVAAYIYDQVS